MSYANQLLPREKVFRDPVHNYIYVRHQVILDLINTPEFQRLRRIKQLGTSSFTFHGAEHSRFTHSLGVYEIARRICNNFQRNFPSKTPGDGLWDDSERIVALCAALLHDIGHGAYSHTFEHIFHTDHEAITRKIITNPSTQVNKVLLQVSDDFPQKVASVIDKSYPNKQVVQMISSQCDADRMDYLLRDSYSTGTSYGNFDLTRILRIMRPYENGICFDMNGMHTIEDYIIGRMQMYLQVYFHPVSRSMEVILNHLLLRAKDLYRANQLEPELMPYLLIPFFNQEFSLSDYLELDDGVLNTYFIHWKKSNDPILSDLAHRFIDRRPFKSAKYDKEDLSTINKMKKLVAGCGYDTKYYTGIDNSFNLPYDSYDTKKEIHDGQIKLINPDGSFVGLSDVSDLVRVVTNKIVSENRFFFPRELIKSDEINLFSPMVEEFRKHIKNDHIINE
ncbi:HD domain-containing protein [Lactobacillus sp. Sy-1]|uniref:HD domain-containing protein n=1 Tax=Lactobacillus sp. Sy-1 TaxID=2109645 RepID=UPI001C59B8EB|nr:HD domain-containing protein [Lactobacillus sp. Sy-1]MBW1604799.1 HD domain-containing protein [Lactobacillus sp. Sy-1]